MNTGKVLLGVLAGVAAGATLGILFAPDKGSTTRKKIIKKGDDYADELKEKLENVLTSITDKFSTSRDPDLNEQGKSKNQETKREARNGVNEKVPQ